MKNISEILSNSKINFDEKTDYKKDEHIYCKTCNERLDSEPMEVFENSKFIVRLACECVKEKMKEEKQREIMKERERLRNECFLDKRKLGFTFENASEYDDKELLNKAKRYVDNFEEMKKENIGLILYGSVGSGKTYLACAIANEIIKKYGYRAKMKNFSNILNDLQSGGFTLDRNEYIRNLTSPTLLVIDDFGIERNTEYALENIYNVINARYEREKPTIITTNINFNNLTVEQENIMLGRIYSRILEMCLPLRIVQTDRRKKKSNEKIKKAIEIINGESLSND